PAAGEAASAPANSLIRASRVPISTGFRGKTEDVELPAKLSHKAPATGGRFAFWLRPPPVDLPHEFSDHPRHATHPCHRRRPPRDRGPLADRPPRRPGAASP